VPESIFDELSPDDRREVMRRAKRSSFKAREIIFREGDLGNTLQWIESGLVAVRSTSLLGDTVTFVVLGAGDTFGELALILPESARSASVVAVSATRTLALQRQDFEELRSTHPDVDQLLLVALARTVQHLSARVIEAHYIPADKRVVRRVTELVEAFGDTALPFTQDDLAGLAGTTRQTVNKVLRECEAAGLVKLSRGTVTVIDNDRLSLRAR
jgi:CRP-like cAMP-binding protein